MVKVCSGLLVFGLLLPRIALGWGSAGHEVIAAEAWRQLTPELKAEAIDVLKHHPQYGKWTNAYHPNASFDVYAYAFMRCSVWPDEIRRAGNKYDHPEWHFVDYPLRPPSFPVEPGPKPGDDVLYGVAQSEKILSDPAADAELRAVMLSYLVHLVGDIHQPLHCASLFNEVFTNGDRGGNDFYVKPPDAQKGVGLHSIWDGLLGGSANPRTEWNYAIQIDSQHPRASLAELGKDPEPKEWSLESRLLAVKAGYLDGTLKSATTPAQAAGLPSDYMKNAKAVAEKQAALAGYRLADEIGKYLKCSGPVAALPANPVSVDSDTGPKTITCDQATNYYDQEVILKARVMQVSVKPSITYLNLDKNYPDSPVTVVIFPAQMSEFPDVQKFKGQEVLITGTVQQYRGKPEIVLEKKDQLKAVEH